MSQAIFEYDKLDVYRLSIEYVAASLGVAKQLTGLHRHARDQWLRAARSIPLDIAEGTGKRSLKDRNRFLDIAIGVPSGEVEQTDNLPIVLRHGTAQIGLKPAPGRPFVPLVEFRGELIASFRQVDMQGEFTVLAANAGKLFQGKFSFPVGGQGGRLYARKRGGSGGGVPVCAGPRRR